MVRILQNKMRVMAGFIVRITYVVKIRPLLLSVVALVCLKKSMNASRPSAISSRL